MDLTTSEKQQPPNEFGEDWSNVDRWTGGRPAVVVDGKSSSWTAMFTWVVQRVRMEGVIKKYRGGYKKEWQQGKLGVTENNWV